MSIELNRRSLVNGAVAVAGAAALSPLLAACGGGGNSKAGKTRRKGGTNCKKGAAAAMPDYVPSTAVKADIPSASGAAGTLTDAGFLELPGQPGQVGVAGAGRGRPLHHADAAVGHHPGRRTTRSTRP